MKWFKHDTDAHADARIDKVIMHYGAAGYAVYWYCLELVAGKVSRENITFELEHDAEQIGHRLKVDSKQVMAILQYFVDVGLFENRDGTITCLKLAQRLDASMTGSPGMRQIIKGIKCHDTIMTESEIVIADKNRLDKKRLDKNKHTHSEISEGNSTRQRVPFSQIVDLYHETLPNLPKCEKLTDARRGAIRQRWEQDLPDLNNWKNFFSYVAQSDFLTGRVEPQAGKRLFRANLEWLTKQGNYVKILEGRYHG